MLPFTADPTQCPEVTAFFDPATNALSYVVRDPGSDACAIIDPVLDFDPAAGRIGTAGADAIVAFVRERRWRLEWLIETHVHADHASASAHIKRQLGGRLGIGRHVTEVQEIFAPVFKVEAGFRRDGSQFDHLFGDGETYAIGGLRGHAIETPGHTPACMSHVIGDAAFVGDTLFLPDSGTARADFRGGSARALHRSIQRILELPPQTRLFVCHDYGEGGRPIAWETSVAATRAGNDRAMLDEAAFVAWRQARDATLAPPRLIISSLQINIRAGELPPPDADGRSYLTVPLGQF